ncbi:hypothetical protein AJ79_10042, partial [Helicocarpus griseus UAMH5409]
LSTVTANKSFQLRPRIPTHNTSGPTRTSSWSPIFLQSAGLSARFNSTSTNPVTDPAAAASWDAFNKSTPSSSSGVDAIDSLSPADLSTVDISQIPEKLGYLKAIGLDYGWGPSAMTESVLEIMHIYGGLPWWGAAIALAALIRFGLFKPAIRANNATLRTQKVKHLTEPLLEQMRNASATGDSLGLQRASQQRKIINEENGIKASHIFWPMVQIPLGYGAFRVLRGMATLPVPGLDAESFLWIYDFTSRDPYFILPVATGLIMYQTVKMGAKIAPPSNHQAMMSSRAVLVGFPIVSTIATAWFPAIVQLFFATSSVLAGAQSAVFANPRCRAMLGMDPLPDPSPPGGPDASLSKQARIIDVKKNPDAGSQAESEVQQPSKVSFVDRALGSFQDQVKNTRQKMVDYAEKKRNGADKPETYADGTPKVRFSKKELERAAEYENLRREELALEREKRNKMKAMEIRRKKMEEKRRRREEGL